MPRRPALLQGAAFWGNSPAQCDVELLGGRKKACFSVNAPQAGCQIKMGAIFHMVFRS